MKNYFDLSGQVAVVTGCSTGLDVQMAKALENQGAKVVAIARRKEMIDKVAADLAAEFGVETLAAEWSCKGINVNAIGNSQEPVTCKYRKR